MTFNPNAVEGFMFKVSAMLYAYRARKAGYDTDVYRTENWILNGGPWFVELKERKK
jgi:hypothetical protein